MAKNNKSGSRSKHIDIKYLAIRERVKEMKVVIEHISTGLMNLWIFRHICPISLLFSIQHPVVFGCRDRKNPIFGQPVACLATRIVWIPTYLAAGIAIALFGCMNIQKTVWDNH